MADEPNSSARRRLPLAGGPAPELEPSVRRIDRVRPIYAVWELTLRCDLACQHCGSRAGHARPDELSTAGSAVGAAGGKRPR
jgi:MoaA/NifB/PqqE/SkfB family radical SAM enzyme